jgi:hypothetical protein
MDDIRALAARLSVAALVIADGAEITHSYWGAPEAGIAQRSVYVRSDTPVHSLLHELCHIVCMTEQRRAPLARDAGGDPAEECAVCYLQITLANYLPGYSAESCLDDMDAWGYSFREGNVRDWLAGDGRDARAWLIDRGLIDAAGRPTWRLRQ